MKKKVERMPIYCIGCEANQIIVIEFSKKIWKHWRKVYGTCPNCGSMVCRIVYNQSDSSQ